jgi:uncharacterized membrane protein
MSAYKINDNGVDREMTEAEAKAFDKTLSDTAKDQASIETEKQAKAQAKAAVLAKLGLSADEVAALLS